MDGRRRVREPGARPVGRTTARHAAADRGGAAARTNLAFAPRGKVALPNLVAQDVPELGVERGKPLPGGAAFTNKPQGCGCQTSDSGGLVMGLLALGWLGRRRRPAARCTR